jgi:S-formylglutathione hydrolase FrmB
MSTPRATGEPGHCRPFVGGYGAIKLAMKHPQVFGAVYALSACCLGWDNGWSATSPAWQKALAMRSMDDFTAVAKLVAAGNPRDPQWLSEFLSIADIAIATAFSPNPERPPFY